MIKATILYKNTDFYNNVFFLSHNLLGILFREGT